MKKIILATMAAMTLASATSTSAGVLAEDYRHLYKKYSGNYAACMQTEKAINCFYAFRGR